MKILYLVIPCYNEEEVLPETVKRLTQKLTELIAQNVISAESRAMLVDDGSKDRTWELISAACGDNPLFEGLRLSRNRGHQNALLAGLMTAKQYADAVISLDADLQDDIGAIDEMVGKFLSGCDIVYGVRSARKTDTAFKRITAQGYYRLLTKMGVEITYNHADYRLMSRRALDALESFSEVNLFLRGIVPMIGFKTDTVYYERSERFAGVSKYPVKKMLAFAFEGITSLSVKPIRMICSLGVLIFLVSIGMLIYFLIRHFSGATVEGWTSIAVSVWAIGGLQLLAIGVIGEYVGKTYLEVKRRPKFIIDEHLQSDKGDKTE